MTQADVNIYTYLLIYSFIYVFRLSRALTCLPSLLSCRRPRLWRCDYFLARKTLRELIAHTLVLAGQADIARSV